MSKVTTQKELRAMFWRDHPTLSKRKITSYDGQRKMFCTDTRVAFSDYVDALCREGTISDALASRATLGGD